MILLVGDTTRPEFAIVGQAASLPRGSLPGASWQLALRRVPDLDAAENLLADSETIVEAILVAQAYPGEFSAGQIDRLRRRAPLVPIVSLLGSWCEGEMRSGHPWPGAARVYWHQFSARAADELPRLLDGLISTWSLPPTAGDDERVLALADQPLPQGAGHVVVYSPEYEMFDWLAAAVTRSGYKATWLHAQRQAEIEHADAVVFDGTEFRGEELDAMRALAVRFAPAPLVALVGFPRVEDRDRILAAGASAILSKPVLLEDLIGQLTRAKAVG